MLAHDPKNPQLSRHREEGEAMLSGLQKSKLRDRHSGSLVVLGKYAVFEDVFLKELPDHPHFLHLSGRLDEFNPHILHISAHGGINCFSFQDERGYSRMVTKDDLNSVLGFHQNLELIALSSCHSDRGARATVYVVGSVIGIFGMMSDPAAIAFAR
jgi:hypothetical protein